MNPCHHPGSFPLALTAPPLPHNHARYDAENRLVKANGMTGAPWCYVYDGSGLRVAKKSGTNSDCTGGTFTKLYWRALSGDALAETDGSGSTTNAAYAEYVFFAGRRTASRVGPSNGNSSIFYYFADQLGSVRTITTGSGSGQTPGQLCYDVDFTPYGQEISYSGRLQTTACAPNYKFTGYERDPETGLDYAFARYYSSRLGRFLSTDPLGGSIGNLQSHNAYAYVVNNPLNLTDPFGLCPHGRPGECDGYITPPCLSEMCVNGGYGLDGNCYLNGAPASCSMVNGLLSSPSGATLPCPPYCLSVGQRLTDGDNGSVVTQQWILKAAWGSTVCQGNADGSTTCPPITNVTYYGEWVTIATGSGSSDDWGVWDTVKAIFGATPWSVTVTPTPGAITAAWIPATNTWCLGGGVGAGVSLPDVPIGINGGPLVFGDLKNAKDVLAGPSISYGFQPTPGIGWQHTFNTSGQLLGPTAGSWGGGIAFTVSGCKDFK